MIVLYSYVFGFSCIFLTTLFLGEEQVICESQLGSCSPPSSSVWPQHPALYWVTPEAAVQISEQLLTGYLVWYQCSLCTSMALHSPRLRGHIMFPKTSMPPSSKTIKNKTKQNHRSMFFSCSFTSKVAWLFLQGCFWTLNLYLVLHKTIQQQVISFLH